MEKLFILYDGRAKMGDTDEAWVLIVANSEAEARKDGEDYRDQDAIWYEYDVKPGSNELINGVDRWDIPPSSDLNPSVEEIMKK